MKSAIDMTARIRADLFEAIKYEKRKGRGGAVNGLELSAHFVFKWVFQDAWKHFSASIVTADRCKLHTAKDLFNDPTAWAGLERPIQIAIGRCLMYFADNKMLPLSCTNRNSLGSKYYQVTDQ